jgi:hypothetical protein
MLWHGDITSLLRIRRFHVGILAKIIGNKFWKFSVWTANWRYLVLMPIRALQFLKCILTSGHNTSIHILPDLLTLILPFDTA